MKELTLEEAKYRAAAYCSKSEKCLSDVIEKLKQWGINNEQRNYITEFLITEKYIDEQRYAESYAKDKFRFNKWGKSKIGIMLRNKGIDTDVIEKAIGTIDYEDYENTLRQLLNDKKKAIKDTDDYKIRGKLYNYGISKGFEYNIITHVIDTI